MCCGERSKIIAEALTEFYGTKLEIFEKKTKIEKFGTVLGLMSMKAPRGQSLKQLCSFLIQDLRETSTFSASTCKNISRSGGFFSLYSLFHLPLKLCGQKLLFLPNSSEKILIIDNHILFLWIISEFDHQKSCDPFFTSFKIVVIFSRPLKTIREIETNEQQPCQKELTEAHPRTHRDQEHRKTKNKLLKTVMASINIGESKRLSLKIVVFSIFAAE